MPLCIINVDEFRFDAPKISWAGTDDSTVHSTKESHTILLNTIYDFQITKTLQKFNGTDWIDVADININYNVTYDAEGTDKYRLKATRSHKVLYSNELIIVKLLVVPIEFDGDPAQSSNVCIRFTKDLPGNVRSHTLVVVSDTTSQRYANTKCFQDNNGITAVYVEYEYSDGYKANSNTLQLNRPKTLQITWHGGGTEDREGYNTTVSVESSNTNVSWQIYNEQGQWVNASFSGHNINVKQGVTKIRGVLHRYNLISNVLVYNRVALIPLNITWHNGGTAIALVYNDTNLAIKLHPGYIETGIKDKVMHIHIDGHETLVNVDDLSNMSYKQQGEIMYFRLKFHYNDGTILESNLLMSKTLLIPKITWEDKTDKPKSLAQDSVRILASNLIFNDIYTYQVSFSTMENDTHEQWGPPAQQTGYFDTSRSGWYKFRVISNKNPQLVSNVLILHRIASTKNGTIKWKDTTDKIVYNNTIPIVVNADAPDEGGSYKIVVNTYMRHYDYSYPQEIGHNLQGLNNSTLGSIGTLNPNRWNGILATYHATAMIEGTNFISRHSNVVHDNQIVQDYVGNTSEIDISTSLVVTYGVHYFSLVYTNRDGENYKIGNPIIAVIRSNRLTISEYVYEDEWGISKQTPEHPMTRYEVKSSWAKQKSRGFVYEGRNTDDELNYQIGKTLQKQRLNEQQWTDVNDIHVLDSSFMKEKGIVKYRLKSQLHNGEIQYSDEVYTFYVGDFLKFDTDKYYIVENIFTKNDQEKYNDIENQHEVTATLLETFTYQYQISVNGGDWQNVGNTFTKDNPLTFNNIFTGGYPSGIVLIRLECRTTLDTQVRYSNLIYAMFNAATMSWQEDDDDRVSEINLIGVPPYRFSITDIYKYKTENNGELKIYVNKTDPQQKTYQQIIDQDQVIKTKEQAEGFNETIDPNVEGSTTYGFTFSWVNSFAITHKGRSVINATWLNPEISIRPNNSIRIPYEVKTTYTNAADIYYDYQHPTVVVHRHVNNTNIIYTLERANLDSEDFTQDFVLSDRQNGDTEGDYVIERNLSQGKYRIKQTVNNTKHIYSNIVTLYSFNDILKVNNTYAVFGFNNTVANSGYDNQTQYNITYNVEPYPETFRFKVQWCHSLTSILAGDTVSTIDHKKVMTMNHFVDIGTEFSKTETIHIKELVRRHNGLVRIRLKVLDGENIIGYSNVIWIYLDYSISHFVDARVGNEDTTFPLYVEGDSRNGRLERLISSNVFAIQVKNQYPDQRSDIYILTWNGTDWNNINANDKYGRLLFRLTGNGANGDRNRTPNVYLYYRKTIIQPFNITLEPTEPPLEQVVMTAELINEHRFFPASMTYRKSSLHNTRPSEGENAGHTMTSGVSSTRGNWKVLRYNNGSVNLPFEFILYESPNDTENWSKASGDFPKYDNPEQNILIRDWINGIPEEPVRNVNNNGLKERKFTYENHRSIKNKIRIKYKNRYIKETNAVYFPYFKPIISLSENEIGDNVFAFKQTGGAIEITQHEGETFNLRNDYIKQQREQGNVTYRAGENNVVVYANNTYQGYAYKFQIKKVNNSLGSYRFLGTTIHGYNINKRATRFIDENGFQDIGNFFTSNDRMTIRKENPEQDTDKYYAVRVAIYNRARDTIIGYSNVVYVENIDLIISNT